MNSRSELLVEDVSSPPPCDWEDCSMIRAVPSTLALMHSTDARRKGDWGGLLEF